MIFTPPPQSYLFGILADANVNESDVLSISISDLREFKRECESNTRFKAHPYYLSVKDVCEYFHITNRTLYKWIESGKVHGIRIGRKWMVREIDILDINPKINTL